MRCLYYQFVFQYFNYVYHYDCHIFSIQHIYIVLYCMWIFAFTLIFNILDIEVHYDCYVFTVKRVYSGQNYLGFHTVVLKTTTVDFETTGVDFCTSDRFLSSDFVLCSSANCSNKSADDEVLCGVTFTVLCAIVRYCALS